MVKKIKKKNKVCLCTCCGGRKPSKKSKTSKVRKLVKLAKSKPKKRKQVHLKMKATKRKLCVNITPKSVE